MAKLMFSGLVSHSALQHFSARCFHLQPATLLAGSDFQENNIQLLNSQIFPSKVGGDQNRAKRLPQWLHIKLTTFMENILSLIILSLHLTKMTVSDFLDNHLSVLSVKQFGSTVLKKNKKLWTAEPEKQLYSSCRPPVLDVYM